MAELAPVDLVILAVVGVSVLIGAVRGFVREAFSLAVWVAAFIVAALGAREASGLLEGWVSDAGLRMPVAFGALFLAALILGNLLVRVLGMLVDATGLTGLDRMLGTLFGGARAVVLLIVISAFAAPLFADTGWWQASRLVPWLVDAQADLFELFDRIASTAGGWIGA